MAVPSTHVACARGRLAGIERQLPNLPVGSLTLAIAGDLTAAASGEAWLRAWVSGLQLSPGGPRPYTGRADTTRAGAMAPTSIVVVSIAINNFFRDQRHICQNGNGAWPL